MGTELETNFYNIFIGSSDFTDPARNSRFIKSIQTNALPFNEEFSSNNIILEQDQLSVKLAQELQSTIKSLMDSLYNLRLLPDIKKNLDLYITNVLSSERIENYKLCDGDNLPHEILPFTTDTKIYLPIDIADISLKVFDGTSFEHGNKRFFSFVPQETENIKYDVILRSSIFTVLNHEIGHYYLNQILAESKAPDLTNENMFSNKHPYVTDWFSLLHEGFAESWAITITEHFKDDRNLIWKKQHAISNLCKLRYSNEDNDKSNQVKYDLNHIYKKLEATTLPIENISWECLKLSYENANKVLGDKLDKSYKYKLQNLFFDCYGINTTDMNNLGNSSYYLNKNSVISQIDKITSTGRSLSLDRFLTKHKHN